MKVGLASFPLNEIDKIEATDVISRDMRNSTSIITVSGGKTIATFEDVYKEATGKSRQV